MQITVFGASGKVGSLVVQNLLSKGYYVVAFVHNDSTFKANNRLKILSGDIHLASDIKNALIGSDAVISTLGSWNTVTKDILSSAMKLIIPEMEKQKITRIISLTGSDARLNTDKAPLFGKFTRPIIKLFAPKILNDSEEHMKSLTDSKLTWTIVRSPVMIGSKSASKYTLDYKYPKPWQIVHRNSVADALCSLLTDQKYNNSSPYVH